MRKRDDGSLVADLFDGEGFVRGVLRKGRELAQTSALIVGAGGVGSAIAASLAAAGVTRMGLVDAMGGAAESLGERLTGHYADLTVRIGSADPTGYDLVVNATPLGMNDGDPLPIDMNLLSSSTFVGEVVMKSAVTPFLRAARERGCETQVGVDMLFEQVPANLEFLGFGTPPQMKCVSSRRSSISRTHTLWRRHRSSIPSDARWSTSTGGHRARTSTRPSG